MHLLRLDVVLAAVDYDEPSVASLRAAHELASTAGAALHVVHVDPAAGAKGEKPTASSASSGGADEARTILTRAGVGEGDAQVHRVEGNPALAIRALSDRIRADVIVLGPHRRRSGGRGGSPLGSTALGIVTSSWAPCLVASRSLTLPLRRVLVPVDLSDTASGALLVGLTWASALRPNAREHDETAPATASLTALHVRRPDAAPEMTKRIRRWLDSELQRLRDNAGSWAGVEVSDAIVDHTDIAAAIAAYCAEHRSDLVVLGTRGLGLDAVGRLGSVSAAVAERLETPVLLVPPAVWTAYSRASVPSP